MKLPLLIFTLLLTSCTVVDLSKGRIVTWGNSQGLTMTHGTDSVHWDTMDHAVAWTAAGAGIGNVAGTVLTGLSAYKAVTSGVTGTRTLAAALPATTVGFNRHTNRGATPTPIPQVLRVH